MKVTSKMNRPFSTTLLGKSITIPKGGSVSLSDEVAKALVDSHPDCFDVGKDDPAPGTQTGGGLQQTEGKGGKGKDKGDGEGKGTGEGDPASGGGGKQ